MTSLRTIVVACLPLAALAACSPDAPPPAKPSTEATPAPASAAGPVKRERLAVDDPHALPLPGEDVSKPPPIVSSAAGKLEVMIEGQPAHLMRLPPGQNRAVWVAGSGLARVSLAASEPDTGLPHLRFLVEGVRIDQTSYPVTIRGRAKDGPIGEPSLTVRYQVSDKRLYVLDPAKDADVALTLEGFEGSTLHGRFEGKLAPTAAGLGDPIPISGKFSVELGLQGIEPAGTAKPAP